MTGAGAFPRGRPSLPSPLRPLSPTAWLRIPVACFFARALSPTLRHVTTEAPYWLAENGDITPRGGFPTVNSRKTALRSGKRQENFNCCRPRLLTVAVTENRDEAPKVNKTREKKNNGTGPRKNTGKH